MSESELTTRARAVLAWLAKRPRKRKSVELLVDAQMHVNLGRHRDEITAAGLAEPCRMQGSSRATLLAVVAVILISPRSIVHETFVEVRDHGPIATRGMAGNYRRALDLLAHFGLVEKIGTTDTYQLADLGRECARLLAKEENQS